jgi:dTMP kinase
MIRGRFITLEGSEGAGKSTNLATVCEILDEAGVDYHRTREPGGTPLAEALREALLANWDEPLTGLTELLIVFAAREQHLNQEVRPRLQRGQWVVCDRFTDATYAYQSSARGVSADYVAALEEWVQRGLHPDLSLFLDVDPRQGAARIAGRSHDRMERERLEFYLAVRAGYLARAAEWSRIHVIDANRELASVGADVATTVRNFVDQVHRP